MRDLVERVEGLIVEGGGQLGADALLRRGLLPDGTKVAGGAPRVLFLAYNDPVVGKGKRTEGGGRVRWRGSVTFEPGKGGGAGATIDSRVSNQWFNAAGTERAAVKDMSRAMLAQVKRELRGVGKQLTAWARENLMWRVVGWENRDRYRVHGVSIRRIEPRPVQVDPTRRKWPSGRTEVWVPLVVEFELEMVAR